MAKLYIPQVGDKLHLLENWQAKIFNDNTGRNDKVFKALNISIDSQEKADVDVTFPKGTVLRVDRLYVRAPASSFDSITFTVMQCPIKSLNKARFWVKLLDANNIHFEEIKNSIDSYKKIKDVIRFIALSNGMKNSEYLDEKEVNFVAQKIYQYFNEKNNNPLKASFDISQEDYIKNLVLSAPVYRRNEDKTNEYNKISEKIKHFNFPMKVSLSLLPVLDGFVAIYDINQQAIEIEKMLGIYGRIEKSYRIGEVELGSFFSRQKYMIAYDKKAYPTIFSSLVKSNPSDIDFEYQGKKKIFKDLKEFEKFIKSIRV